MSVRVRRLEARDKPVWLSLFKGYIEFYKATVPEDVIEMTWQRLMAGAADFHVALVAVDDADSPSAWRTCCSTARPGRRPRTATWRICSSIRRSAPKGAGRALIEAAYREADARGCTRTYWATQEFNYRARALYDQVATKSPFVQYRR